MSAFGDGTFKQDMLDELEWRSKDRKLSVTEATAEMFEVLAWFLKYTK